MNTTRTAEYLSASISSPTTRKNWVGYAAEAPKTSCLDAFVNVAVATVNATVNMTRTLILTPSGALCTVSMCKTTIGKTRRIVIATPMMAFNSVLARSSEQKYVDESFSVLAFSWLVNRSHLKLVRMKVIIRRDMGELASKIRLGMNRPTLSKAEPNQLSFA